MIDATYLFQDATNGVSPAHFAGRTEFRDNFTSFAVANKGDGQHRTWMISGIRSMGKTSVCQWCLNPTSNSGRPRIVAIDVDELEKNMPIRELRRKIAGVLWRYGRRRALEGGKTLFWKFYDSCAELPAIGVVFRHKDLTSHDLGVWLVGALCRVGGSLSSFVLVFDKLSEDTDGEQTSAEKLSLFCSIVREIERETEATGHTRRDAPRLVLVGTALPDWRRKLSESGLDKKIPRSQLEIKLRPFDREEIQQLVDLELDLCPTKWNPSKDFASALFDRTGGFPQLVQKLGHLACHNAYLSGRLPSLGTSALDAACDAAAFQELARKTVSESGVAPPARPSRDATLAVLREFSNESKLPDRDAVKGVTKDAWREATKPDCLSTDSFNVAFEEVFRFLQQCLVLRETKDGGSFAFTPIVVRALLPEAAEDWEY